jgi:hypothetical protein
VLAGRCGASGCREAACVVSIELNNAKPTNASDGA